MSRSFRYNPDSDEAKPCRKSRKDARKAVRTTGHTAPSTKCQAPSTQQGSKHTAQGTTITPEWALERTLGLRVGILQGLLGEGLIEECDVSFYDDRLKLEVLEAIPEYDASFRNADGKKCSATHYCLFILERRAKNIRRDLRRLNARSSLCVPISQLGAEEAKELGYVSEETLSDNARSVRELEFRLDVNTLYGSLTSIEAEFLNLRLDDFSERDIVERCRHSRYQVRKVLARIQQKARRFGFLPRSEVEGKINDKSAGYVANDYGSMSDDIWSRSHDA